MTEFKLQLQWEGSTADDYSRNATASAAGKHDISVSASGHYAGDDTRWNPEDLLGASLATCHFLTFLSLAKKYKIDVRKYHDNVSVTLETVDKITRVTTIRLAPLIAVMPGTDTQKVREAFEKSHQYCFIGNSITSKVVMEPNIQIVE